MTAKIVVVGSLNIDLAIKTKNLPSPGQTVVGDSFMTNPGGKGANQAVACARLGADVRLIGRVGTDSYGQLLLENLAAEKVNIDAVSTDSQAHTGIALISVERSGENTIIASYGANMLCGVEEIELAKKAIRDSDVLLLQNEIPQQVNLATAEYARKCGVKTVWDPAPAVTDSTLMLEKCDYFTPNKTETKILLNEAITDVQSAITVSEEFSKLNRAVPIITLGAEGAVYAENGQSFTINPFKINVVDSVAAGDAFAAAVAVAIAEGKDIAMSIKFASATGSLAATKAGAQDSMPYRNEVETLL